MPAACAPSSASWPLLPPSIPVAPDASSSRRRGIGVQYCHGVMAHPFEAHAWVEYHGEVVNDIPEHVRAFARLPAQLP
jgi:hypothetical protein